MINEAFIKFHKLPPEIKLAVTSPQAMEEIDRLEAMYRVPLADLIVQLMVKAISLADLRAHLRSAQKMTEEKAAKLSDELQTGLLRPVLPYLQGMAQPVSVSRAPAEVQAPKSSPAAQTQPLLRPPPPRPQLERRDIPLQRPSAPQSAAPRFVPSSVQKQVAAIQRSAPKAQFSQLPDGKAAYYVFAEDEEEIAKHRQRLERLAGASPTAQVEEAAARIIAKHGIRFPDDPLMKRLRSLLVSRLRDVRTSEELKELLLRSPKVGGMGLAGAVAAEMSDEADVLARQLHDRSSSGALTPSATAAPAIPAPLPQPSTPEPPKPKSPPPPPPPPPIRTVPPHPAAPPAVTTPPRPVIRRPVMSEQPGQRMLHDIKRPAKPVGLVEELAQLTPDDFRLLGTDLEDSVTKVLEKIHLLAEESFQKRAEGVAAWRACGVHQLYLDMGRESMGSGRSIEEVVTDRKRRNQPYLTAVEFAAVADLNRHLTL